MKSEINGIRYKGSKINDAIIITAVGIDNTTDDRILKTDISLMKMHITTVSGMRADSAVAMDDIIEKMIL
jgi:hypothetical protein